MTNSVDWRTVAWSHSEQGSIDVRLRKVPQIIFLKYKETGTSARVPVAPNEWPGHIHSRRSPEVQEESLAGTAAGRDRE